MSCGLSALEPLVLNAFSASQVFKAAASPLAHGYSIAAATRPSPSLLQAAGRGAPPLVAQCGGVRAGGPQRLKTKSSPQRLQPDAGSPRAAPHSASFRLPGPQARRRPRPLALEARSAAKQPKQPRRYAAAQPPPHTARRLGRQTVAPKQSGPHRGARVSARLLGACNVLKKQCRGDGESKPENAAHARPASTHAGACDDGVASACACASCATSRASARVGESRVWRGREERAAPRASQAATHAAAAMRSPRNPRCRPPSLETAKRGKLKKPRLGVRRQASKYTGIAWSPVDC